jgi:hypothetical protein
VIDSQDYTIIGELSPDCSTIVLDHAPYLRRILNTWVGKKLEVNLKVLRNRRSDRQNRWWWGVVIPTVRRWLFETTGNLHEPEAVHIWLQQNVLGYSIRQEVILGITVFIVEGKRTSQMTTVEFTNMVDVVVVFFAEKGVVIPMPIKRNLITDYINTQDQ